MSMPPSSASTESPSDPGAAAQAVRDLMRQRRRTRPITTCFPCRQRKVKCNGRVPCVQCVARQHPEVCFIPVTSTSAILPPRVQRAIAANRLNTSSHAETVDDEIQRTVVEQESRTHLLSDDIPAIQQYSEPTQTLPVSSFVQVRSTHESPASGISVNVGSPEEIRVTEHITGASLFLGPHSDPAMLFGGNGDSRFNVPPSLIDDDRDSVQTTYPFSNIFVAEPTMAQLLGIIPCDADVLRLWRLYNEFVHPFNPVVHSPDDFETELCEYLNTRSQYQDHLEQHSTSLPTWSWLSLVLAVLAAGAQYSDNNSEWHLTSKIFVRASFQCLRAANCFVSADASQIRAMVLIAMCMRNDMNVNASWIYMGIIIRFAQSLGLHRRPSTSVDPEGRLQSRTNRHETSGDAALWWTIIRHDTLMTITCDRPQNTSLASSTFPVNGVGDSGGSLDHSVFAMCQALSELENDLWKAGNGTPSQVTLVTRCLNQINEIHEGMDPSLRDRRLSRGIHQNLSRLTWFIHMGSVVCKLSRRLYNYLPQASDERADCLTRCNRAGIQVLESYLEMHRLAPKLCRSWSFVHNAASVIFANHSLQDVSEGTLRVMELGKKIVKRLEKDERDSVWVDGSGVRHNSCLHGRILNSLIHLYSTQADVYSGISFA